MALLRRYKDGDRMNHWFIALMFVLAGLSGLAFFHPSLFFFTNFFGGGPWTRILHPFLGVLMFVGFLGMFLRLWKDNVVNAADRGCCRNWVSAFCSKRPISRLPRDFSNLVDVDYASLPESPWLGETHAAPLGDRTESGASMADYGR